MDNINERISLILNKLGYNKNSFSKQIGLSSSAVLENIVGKRKSKPSFDILNKICLSFDNLNADWLITGRGEMLKNKEAVKVVNEPRANYNRICSECERKQEIIDMQKQRIESLNMVIDTKNELIAVLRGGETKQTKAG